MCKAGRRTTIDLSAGQLQELLERIGQVIDPSDLKVVRAVFDNYLEVTRQLAQKTVSIQRLKHLVFGAPTEKTDQVLKRPKDPPKRKGKAKGHGRNPASAYRGARTVAVPHPDHQAGDPCPDCLRGNLSLKQPNTIIRITAQPAFAATVHQMEKLRCNACGKVFSAQAPVEAGSNKYDRSVGSMLGVLRYGSGIPNYRIEKLQESFGVPLPASTQWGLLAQCAQTIKPVYRHLIHLAAQAELIYHDDTTMRVLSILRKRSEEASDRSGIFTTGVVAEVPGQRISLFFTGVNHAGENLDQLLTERATDLPPPMQMSDGLSRNAPKANKTVPINCMTHARRNFVEITADFPDQCAFLLESLRSVYRHDAQAREQRMDPEQRLRFHRVHSQPVMAELKGWMEDQLDGKKVEPNSNLGKAINYMLKRWTKLTRFLELPGAPLDNNVCERALKKAILHRKNSLFYKSQNGADIGDLFMSLIHTCGCCGVDPFDYINTLQDHAQELVTDPGLWLPWNFRSTLQSRQAASFTASV